MAVFGVAGWAIVTRDAQDAASAKIRSQNAAVVASGGTVAYKAYSPPIGKAGGRWTVFVETKDGRQGSVAVSKPYYDSLSRGDYLRCVGEACVSLPARERR